MNPNSRYTSADYVYASSHRYDAAGVLVAGDNDGPSLKTRQALYRLQVLPLPEPPSNTYMAKVTDSFPLMSKRLFNDSEQWWVLAEANPQVRHPLDLKAADVLLIPT
jgi:hypothetical protein